jgi:hypothetical protein
VDIERSAAEKTAVKEVGPSPTGVSVMSHSDATVDQAMQQQSEMPLGSIKLSDMSKVTFSPGINQVSYIII